MMNKSESEIDMESERKAHWERVYAVRAVEALSWFQPRAARSMELIAATGVALSAPIIDVGGGASILVDDLHEARYANITVLDIPAAALDAARFGQPGPAPAPRRCYPWQRPTPATHGGHMAASKRPKPAKPVAAKKPYQVPSPNGAREDDYYWLRDDTRKNPEMLAYLNAENAYADAVLAPTKAKADALYREIVGHIKQDDASVPYAKHGYFY